MKYIALYRLVRREVSGWEYLVNSFTNSSALPLERELMARVAVVPGHSSLNPLCTIDVGAFGPTMTVGDDAFTSAEGFTIEVEHEPTQ